MTACRQRHRKPGRRRSHGTPCRLSTGSRGDEGFSLIELILVILIIPIIIFGITAAIIASLQNQSTEFNRLSDTADASIASATFARDIQTATQITTGANFVCPSGGFPAPAKSLLGLQWNQPTSSRTLSVGVGPTSPIPGSGTLTASSNAFLPSDVGSTVSDPSTLGGDGYIKSTITGTGSTTLPSNVAYYQNTAPNSAVTVLTDRVIVTASVPWLATYWDVPEGPNQTAPYDLVRVLCQSAGAVKRISTTTLSRDMPPPANQNPATVTCGPNIAQSTCTPAHLANCWLGLPCLTNPSPLTTPSTPGVTGVSLSASEAASGYQFSLSAAPRYSSPSSLGSQTGGNPAPSLLLLGGGPDILDLNSTGAQLSVTGEMAFNCLDDNPCNNSLVEFDTNNTTLAEQSTSVGNDFQVTNCGSPCSVFALNQTTGSDQSSGDSPRATFPAGSTTPTPFVPAPPDGIGNQPTPCPGISPNFVCGPGAYPNGLPLSGNRKTYTFSGGNYTFGGSGLTLTGHGDTVIFQPGNYTIDGNSLSLTGNNDTITGTGVFFYVAGNAQVTLNSATSSSTSTIDLSPSLIGASAGVVLYQVPTDTQTVTLSGTSGNSVNTDVYGGSIEAPGASVSISDNLGAGSNPVSVSLQSLVAQSLSLTSSTPQGAIVIITG